MHLIVGCVCGGGGYTGLNADANVKIKAEIILTDLPSASKWPCKGQMFCAFKWFALRIRFALVGIEPKARSGVDQLHRLSSTPRPVENTATTSSTGHQTNNCAPSWNTCCFYFLWARKCNEKNILVENIYIRLSQRYWIMLGDQQDCMVANHWRWQ